MASTKQSKFYRLDKYFWSSVNILKILKNSLSLNKSLLNLNEIVLPVLACQHAVLLSIIFLKLQSGLTALHYAAMGGHQQCTEWLKSKQFSPQNLGKCMLDHNNEKTVK